MYDEKDLKTILTRAVEIQKRTDGSHPYSPSFEKLSLEEIEEIARESGLSPDYVRQAAIELEGVPIEKPFFLDTGKRHEVELLGFSKGKFDQKTWAELRSIIETEFKSPGTVKRHPEGIIWRAKPAGFFKFLKPSQTPTVEFKNNGYRTVIIIKKNLKSYNKLLYPMYAALTGSAMILAILFQTGDPSTILAIAVLLGISKLFFSWYNRLIDKSKDKLKETMTQLQTIVNRRFTASEHKSHNAKKISLDESEDRSNAEESALNHQVRLKTR